VDTTARKQTPSPVEAPRESPPPGKDADAQNGPSGADQGA
jgi:hypothetical protein